MKQLHQSSPAELTGIQMENNLLTHEIRLVRTRLRSVVNQLSRFQALDDGGKASLKELRRAHKDVRTLAAELAAAGDSRSWRNPATLEIVERWTRAEE